MPLVERVVFNHDLPHRKPALKTRIRLAGFGLTCTQVRRVAAPTLGLFMRPRWGRGPTISFEPEEIPVPRTTIFLCFRK